MNVSVLVPFRPGCPHREAAWAWACDRWAAAHPSWQVVTAPGPDGPFSRSAAILEAAGRSSGDVVVVADADVWCPVGEAVARVAEHGWAVPHRLVHRLSAESTEKVLAGADWKGLPLSTDNAQDRRPYVGHATGTLVVLRRDVLTEVPPDPRFVGWGQEDDAWAAALLTLVGRPWRGFHDLVHLWHPPQPRLNRRVGSDAGRQLGARYARARRRPAAMRQLIEEVHGCLTS